MSGDIHQPLTSVLSIDDDEMLTLLCDKTTISGRLERRKRRQVRWQRYPHYVCCRWCDIDMSGDVAIHSTTHQCSVN